MIQKYLVLLCAVLCDGMLMPRSFSSNQPLPNNVPPNCQNTTYWKLCNGSARTDYKNSLQRGPGKDGQEFRISEIAVVNDITLDLVVTVPASEKYAYTRKRNNNNFMHVSPEPAHPYYAGIPGPPCWIVIPWKTQTSTKFNWKFVQTGSKDTPPPEELKSITMSIVELDQEKDDDHEYVTFDTEYTKLLHQGTSIRGPSMPTYGKATFTSLTKGVLRDNPSFSGPTKPDCTPTEENPYGCINTMQEARTVRVEYENLTEWEFTIGHEGHRQGDRFLEIYGTVCTKNDPNPCTHVYWDLCRKSLDYQVKFKNTLGFGLGKDDAWFRIKEISVVKGITIDLLLTVPGSETYKRAKNVNQPHVSPTHGHSNNKEKYENEVAPPAPCWIVIPWKVGTATQFNWQFVRTGETTPKVLEEFTLGIAEMDQEKANDHEYVKFDTAYSEEMNPPESTLNHTVDDEDRHVFASTETGTAADNPSVEGPKDGCNVDPDKPYDCLTDHNKRRSLRVKFKNKDNFDISIGHHGRDYTGNADRFLEFYGTTCV